MENPQRRKDDVPKISFTSKLSHVAFNMDGRFRSRHQNFGIGGDGPNRLVLLCLVLLNMVLLIVAVVLGINCVKVGEHTSPGSCQVSHSAATQLIDELNCLPSNYSDLIEATEEAKNELAMVLKNHTLLKVKIELQKTINDNYQRQVQVLQTETTNLKSNITALGNCGGCLPNWTPFNSSCYYFSYIESSTNKKNWPDSRADCIGRGADLVVIDNQQEQTFVSHKLEDMKADDNVISDAFWIGLTDKVSKGTWVWINNVTEVEERYWMDDEPSRGPGEDCATASYSSTNPWKTRLDSNCQRTRRHWICETKSS